MYSILHRFPHYLKTTIVEDSQLYGINSKRSSLTTYYYQLEKYSEKFTMGQLSLCGSGAPIIRTYFRLPLQKRPKAWALYMP